MTAGVAALYPPRQRSRASCPFSHTRIIYLSTLPLLLVAGLFVWFYGRRRLAICQAAASDEYSFWERHFDAPWGRRHFDSFMCIQLRWWALAYAAAFILAWPVIVSR